MLILSSFIYLVSDILVPFVIAFIFAYLLQPVIESNCIKFKLARGLVTAGVFTIFFSSFITIIVLIVPVIYQQISTFINKIPQHQKSFQSEISLWLENLNHTSPEIGQKISNSVNNFVDSAFSIFANFANHIWHYTIATLNFFTIVALVPIILYYFLRDWPKIVSSIESIFPVRGKSKAREIFVSINQLLSGYIRGQLNICMMLAFYYILGLSIIGLDLALLLGILSGFLIIIPFIGAFISFLMVITSCYFAFGAGIELVYVTVLFIVGHSIEGYILAPKIIGDKIGLHPLWILFSVFAAGSIFGFVGVIFAIPFAGIIKVLLSYLLDYYKSSNIYKN